MMLSINLSKKFVTKTNTILESATLGSDLSAQVGLKLRILRIFFELFSNAQIHVFVKLI